MRDLEFIADVNISPLTVNDLRAKGWKIIRSTEIMDARASDLEILKYAREHRQVVITHDLDFSELLAIHGYDGPSVINLRLGSGDPDLVTQRISDIVPRLKEVLKKGIVASVDDISVRFRDLPIR